MIVVEANLISALSGNKERLCTIEIANDVSRSVSTGGSRGDYIVRLYSRGPKPRLIREARVDNWPRNAKPAWRLVQAAFEALGADKEVFK